ncbi:MAG: MBL fold metallo-hydrolase, partial [Gammaproteobacteria bacterium]|nr:MBL fold metallo-hydrolase [Gammaproteobacteria bacterium]NIT62334.1 MBL fold metallo-hydrolase [Gammaproteobacteria bacterium]NIV19275.1 MBL fold metallo-hydrolase [Gammaproteobacteria bacterium]NIY30914.1 MBL fold metallo-hydrolase [Gammaproteobacteria bacterium]
ITHAHFDHFGGLNFALPASGAKVWAHEWDAATISNYPEEVLRGRERIAGFLRQAGMPEGEIGTFMKMHDEGKHTFPGYAVDRPYAD